MSTYPLRVAVQGAIPHLSMNSLVAYYIIAHNNLWHSVAINDSRVKELADAVENQDCIIINLDMPESPAQPLQLLT